MTNGYKTAPHAALRPIYICIGAFLVLSACATPDNMTTKDPYYSTLSQEYRILAEQRRSGHDKVDYKHFTAKAEQAAKGLPVAADAPSIRHLKQETNPNLWTAWAQLDSMPSYIRTAFPRDAARAQVAYECWAEERERNGQRKSPSSCEKQWGALSAQLECPTGCDADNEESLETFEIIFDTNSAAISENGYATLDDIAAYTDNAAHTLRITGYTDRTGNRTYNKILAEKRANTVANALVKIGIPRTSIKVLAQGESEQAITTDDDIKLQANRRVKVDVFEQNQ